MSLAPMDKLCAFLILLMAVSALAGPISRQEYARLRQLLEIAEQRTSSGFWTSAVPHYRHHCSAEYVGDVAQNFDGINDSHEMVEMYELLEKDLMHYCHETFKSHSQRIRRLCAPRTGCAKVTNGFELSSQRDESDDDVMASSVAQVMMQSIGDDIDSADEFEIAFTERGPCRVISDALEHRNLVGYRQYFFTLISLPNYYDEFDGLHQQAADIVAACDYIQTTHGLLQQAYDYYTGLKSD